MPQQQQQQQQLAWLAHVIIAVLLLGLLLASFCRFHWRRARQRKRQEENSLAKALHRQMLQSRRLAQATAAMADGATAAAAAAASRPGAGLQAFSGGLALEIDRDCATASGADDGDHWGGSRGGVASQQQRSSRKQRPGGINVILANFRSRSSQYGNNS